MTCDHNLFVCEFMHMLTQVYKHINQLKLRIFFYYQSVAEKIPAQFPRAEDYIFR